MQYPINKHVYNASITKVRSNKAGVYSSSNSEGICLRQITENKTTTIVRKSIKLTTNCKRRQKPASQRMIRDQAHHQDNKYTRQYRYSKPMRPLLINDILNKLVLRKVIKVKINNSALMLPGYHLPFAQVVAWVSSEPLPLTVNI
ncbi:hypothetical protein KSP39_PZI013413 [Platanthera zijinensis]|uniref:Uncharacterized protein n=1 Tax=Platanthera zijinensis TaxID=2320716 RepID=A0AAP0G3Q8_9ASPA